MSSIAIQFEREADAIAYQAEVPGMDLVPGGHVLNAIYGDEAVDASDDPEFWGERLILPPAVIAGSPHPDMGQAKMPLPWPVVIGFDGMHPQYAGMAMKADGGRWVPVARFAPPLSEEDQAKSEAAALERYADRCAENFVMRAVSSTTLLARRQP